MKIRQAIESDIDEISLLMAQLGYEASPDVISENLIKIGVSKTDEVFVAEDHGKVAGVISCHLTKLFHQAGYAGRITSLIVDQRSRGQSIGKQLVTKAEEYFMANSCSKAEVTSGDHRSSAHAFYESCGYKKDERRFIKELLKRKL